MQQHDLRLDHRPQPSCLLLSLVMVVESFEVEHVPVQLVLRLRNLVLCRRNLLVPLLLQFFILVAVVVPSRFLPMLLPVAQTQPAEFV